MNDNTIQTEPANSRETNEVVEHAMAGSTVTLLIDGEEVEYYLEEGVSVDEGFRRINEAMGVEYSDSSPEIDHPHFELADESREDPILPTGFRLGCRADGCTRTKVYQTMEEIHWSDWSGFEIPIGLLNDSTEWVPASCPEHIESIELMDESRHWPLHLIV